MSPEQASAELRRGTLQASVEPLEGNKVKVSVEVDEQEFEKAVNAAFKRIAREVRPSLTWPVAYRLAEHAWRHLRCSPQLSVDELVDYTWADEPDVEMLS